VSSVKEKGNGEGWRVIGANLFKATNKIKIIEKNIHVSNTLMTCIFIIQHQSS